MKIFFLLAAFTLYFTSIFAQPVQFKLDLTNPKVTLKLFQAEDINDEDIRELMLLPTTPKLLRKLGIDSLTMVSALKKARAGQKPDNQEARLEYDMIVENLDSLADFVSTVEANTEELLTNLNESLGDYFPVGTNVTITIYGMMGGWANGYTFGDVEEFFMSLQKLDFDYNVLYALAEHELFHNVQSASYDINPFLNQLDSMGLKNDFTIMRLFNNLWQEGSASYMARSEKYEQTDKIIAYFQSFQSNARRMGQLTYLIDRLMVNAYQQSDPNFARIYQLLFGYEWNELGYYFGYRMLNRLVAGKSEEERKATIRYYLQERPTLFILDYITLTKPENNEYNYNQFSDEFIRIVERLDYMAKNDQTR